MPGISVIICSHNPRPAYLQRTLDSLKKQSLSRTEWELLLVDNGSKDPLASSWDLSWHPRHRHIREEELGLTPARLRGLREAQGDLLVFVDDDNVLAPDYLDRAARIARTCQQLGVFGAGILEPEYEVPPAPQLAPFLSMLALRTVSSTLWSNNCRDYSCIPWGAGLCVTRPISGRYTQLVQRLNISTKLDRCGPQLFCGGDDLFSWAAAGVGLGFGIFPELRVTHLIGSARLQPPYFLRLVHDHAYSHGILRFLLFREMPRKSNPVEGARNLLHGMRRGWFSFRCKGARARGTSAALRFIGDNHLNPLPHDETGF